jgi:hypothetical protein
MVRSYLASSPDPERYDFLQHDFDELGCQYGGIVATTFRNFPSYPQRYMEPLQTPPCDPVVKIEPLKPLTQPVIYTADDLHVRQFTGTTARRFARTHRAA